MDSFSTANADIGDPAHGRLERVDEVMERCARLARPEEIHRGNHVEGDIGRSRESKHPALAQGRAQPSLVVDLLRVPPGWTLEANTKDAMDGIEIGRDPCFDMGIGAANDELAVPRHLDCVHYAASLLVPAQAVGVDEHHQQVAAISSNALPDPQLLDRSPVTSPSGTGSERGRAQAELLGQASNDRPGKLFVTAILAEEVDDEAAPIHRAIHG